MSAEDDLKLVRKARAGDKDSYRVLVEKYQMRAFSIAYEIVRSREEAEDVVQEAFVKAYLSLKNFQEKSAFYTWLYRIVYNMAIDFKRKTKRRAETSLENNSDSLNSSEVETSYEVKAPETPLEVLERTRQMDKLSLALATISEEHRTVVLLREVDGMSYERIAEVTGVSIGTVMSRLHYARKRLQGALRDVNNEAPSGAP